MSINVNGAEVKIKISSEGSISYDYLCELAKRRPEMNPTVSYATPDGRFGTVIQGGIAPLMDGTVYNVMYTGNA